MSDCCCNRERDCCGCQRDENEIRKSIREIREGLRCINKAICDARDAMRDSCRCRHDDAVSELCKGKKMGEEGLENLIRNSCFGNDFLF